MTSASHNARGQLTGYTAGNGLVSSQFASNRVIPNTRSFRYDPRYRLIRATGKRHKNATDGIDALVNASPSATDYLPYIHRYAYDAVGNFTTNQEYKSGTNNLNYQSGAPDLFDGSGAERGTKNVDLPVRPLNPTLPFDKLTEEVQSSTGQMVAKIDPGALEALKQELESEARTRKLRAVAMSIAMDCAAGVEMTLHRLLADPDHFVRLAAAKALGKCHTLRTYQALQKLAADSNAAMRDTVQALLAEFDSEPFEVPKESSPTQSDTIDRPATKDDS